MTLSETISACRLAVDDLKGMLAAHATGQVGIASQNIIEDYMRHLECQQKVNDTMKNSKERGGMKKL